MEKRGKMKEKKEKCLKFGFYYVFYYCFILEFELFKFFISYVIFIICLKVFRG